MNLSDEDISLVRQTYKNGLSFPERNKIPTHQFFLCTVGLVGAGKSTVIKLLSEKLSLVRVSSDEIRQTLKGRNVSYEQLIEIVKPLVEELIAEGFSIAFDADCGNPKTKEMIIDLAEKIRAKIFWIHIDPPEDFILNKLKTYRHTWLFKNGEEAVENYFKQKKKRQEENTYFDFLSTIDTSKLNLKPQIEQTLALIKSEMGS